MLDSEDESEVPKGVGGIVKVCRDEYHVNGIDRQARCAEEVHPALLDDQPVDHANVVAILAETRDN